MAKVLNRKTATREQQRDAVYIGRPSRWGNPFLIGRDGSREQVVEKYREWIISQPILLSLAKEKLAGKDLVCFCSPSPCHGDILLEIANGQGGET